MWRVCTCGGRVLVALSARAWTASCTMPGRWRGCWRPVPLAVYVWGVRRVTESLRLSGWYLPEESLCLAMRWVTGHLCWLRCVRVIVGLTILAVVEGWHSRSLCRTLSACAAWIIALDVCTLEVACVFSIAAAVLPSFPPRGRGRAAGRVSARGRSARDGRCRTSEEVSVGVAALVEWCALHGRLPKQRVDEEEEAGLANWVINFRRMAPAAMTEDQIALVRSLLARRGQVEAAERVEGLVTSPRRSIRRVGSSGKDWGRPADAESQSRPLVSHAEGVCITTQAGVPRDKRFGLGT